MVADSAWGHTKWSLSGRKTSEESFESKEGIILMKEWLIQVQSVAWEYVGLKERRKDWESRRQALGEGYASCLLTGVCLFNLHQ